MARKKEQAKITKAVAKSKVVQKVTVNIGGRAGRGRKSTAPRKPPRPLPAQPIQIFNSLPPPAQQGESMIQSAHVLNRLLEPVNMRLEALIRQRRYAPLPPQNVEVQRLPDVGDHRQRALDLPDAPLIQPDASLIPSGVQQMDDLDADPSFGKREAQSQSASASASSASSASAGSGFNYDTLTLAAAAKLKVRRRQGDDFPEPSLEEAVRHFGIQISHPPKDELLRLLAPRLQNRK